MARAYKCDLCRKYIEFAHHVSGLDFKIGEGHDEFTGTYEKKHEVNEICSNCYEKIIKTVISLHNYEE